MKKLIAAIKKMVRFLNKDIWNIHDSANKSYRRLYYRTLKIVLIAARGFVKDKCSLRASALTFYSMLSIVPVLAMAFGIAQGFGFRKSWSQWLRQNFSGQEDVLDEIIAFVDNLLANVNGGVVAGAGLIFLFWTVLQLMNNIEESLNTVWETDRPRTWERKFTDYLTVVLIAPVLVFISSGITVFVTGQIESALSLLSIDRYVQPAVEFIGQLIPYALIWLLLTLVYMIMPNVNVKFQSALAAGILAGALYQITQWGYITFQIGVSRYGAIYSTFAALPLFMIWLQLSWLIFLFGAEISFAHQNVARYKVEKETVVLSLRELKLLTLLVAMRAVQKFQRGEKPPSAADLAHELNLSAHYVDYLLDYLIQAGILCRAAVPEPDQEKVYLPCQNVDRLTIQYVLSKIESVNPAEKDFSGSEDSEKLKEILDDFDNTLSSSPANKKLAEI